MQSVESCWIEIDPCNGKSHIVIGCIYRHPNANMEEFTNQLDEIMKQLQQRKYQVYILGDMNIDFLKYGTHTQTEEYLDMLYSNNFLPLITKPTRVTSHTATLIDHIYTNTSFQQTSAGIANVDISDHLPTFCIADIPVNQQKNKLYFRDFSHFDKELYLRDIQDHDWNAVFEESSNLNEITLNTIQAINTIVDKHVPKKQVSANKRKQLNKPWITGGILKSIKIKQKMYKSHFLSNNANKIEQYKTYSNKLNRIKNHSKKSYYCKHFEKCKSNLKATWKLIGTLIKRKTKGQTCPSRIVRNNKTYTSKSDIAEQFNQHFINVGPSLARIIEPNNDNPTQFIKPLTSSFVMSNVTELEVCQLFSNLDDNKASINIPNKLIKIACNPLSRPFTYIYNKSIANGVVPDILKESQVTPIYKGGEVTDPGNYRPISILSPFSKVLERIIYNQMQSFLTKYNILFEHQFGFRKGHSTEQAILEITDNLKWAIDNKQITCGLFLDFSKAFDTVNHSILLAKLHAYGIRGMPLKWFENYLQNRLQYVKLGDFYSRKELITCGVPQGSTLWPLLFLLYINDMPNCSKKLSFRIFADDTNIFFSCKNLKELESVMNNEFKTVLRYCATNKLSVNFKKTNYMLISSPRKLMHTNININGIKRSNCIKYLGIYIDEHLSWDSQITHINNKIAKNIGIIDKLRYYLNLHMLKQIYYSLIYPYFELWPYELGQYLQDKAN